MKRNTGLEPDAVFRDARRRNALVFHLNVALSAAVAVILIGAITAGIILGFLGHAVSTVTLGGVALLDLIGAAVYRPLGQVNRAYLKSQQIDILILSARERLQSADSIHGARKRMSAVKMVWGSILADLNELQK
jgi:hypothetical protein